jgi:predicted HTH transcriptional regulator
VLRARTAQETVDACLRAGEILARYIAAVAISSYAAREDDDAESLIQLDGNLSFGNFLTVSQQVARMGGANPLATYISAGFKARKGAPIGPTDAALTSILNVRNDLGHDLNTLDAAKARAILAKLSLPKILTEALHGVEGLLNLPLFIVEDQQFAKKVFRARRLLLMGESNDPAPEEIEISSGVDEIASPYIAVNQTILRLPPALIWDLIEEKANFQLLFIDSLDGEKTKYKTVAADKKAGHPGASDELRRLCAGERRTSEATMLADGRHLAREWTERRKLLEEAAQRGEGLIPWELLDVATMEWMAVRLDKEEGKKRPSAVLQEKLLDGRTSINGHERRQLVLLFGKPEAVSAELRRDVMMLQIQKNDIRWDERVIIGKRNLLGALKETVEFLSKQFGEANLTFEGLANAAGHADYIAIRECLINQFIHQDYTDPSAPAQIVIRSNETVLFNAGHSLVDPNQLSKGGRSQSRNPLIARALKLVGFADLGGSGIRVLENAWRRARRRPPTFENNRDANNFTLTLDWRPLPALHDAFWHNRLGVKLTEPQAKILEFIRIEDRTLEEISDAMGIAPDELLPNLEYMERQIIIQRQAETYKLMDHIKGILG